MTQDLSKVTFRMAVIYGILFSLNSLSTCIVASLLNADWSDLSGTKKVILCIAIVGNWTGSLMAFLSKTMARMEAGKPPIVEGDTTFTTKQTTTVETKTE